MRGPRWGGVDRPAVWCRAAIAVPLLVGCMPDDWNGEPYLGPDGTGTTEEAPAFAGSWISEGADLSELFAAEPFSYERVEAVFEAAGGYSVTSTAEGAEYVLTGTWVADEASVTLLQVTPYEAEAAGIWEVDGDVLTWEVVQTVPDYGFVPPTPESGFGTTSGPGLEAGANVQIYRRLP